MSDIVYFTDAKADLLRELVKQQQVANVIAALDGRLSGGYVHSGDWGAAEKFVQDAIHDIVQAKAQ